MSPDRGSRRWLLVLGIALVALNLRPAIASVGPLVADIRAATGLPNPALGLLTTLPLLAFGFLSAFASVLSRRVGMERAVAIGLVLIGGGTALRAAPSVAALYTGTLLLGVGVALGNVLLPALSKRHFPSRSGGITSLYSSMMGLGATAAAGLSVPIAVAFGWRGSLGIWVLPAVVALVVWVPQILRRPTNDRLRRGLGLGRLGRSPLAWQIALFMGLQSLTFYVVVAWLPDLLQSRGMTEAAAGGLLALSQATGVVGTAVVPIWAGRVRDQRPIVWALGILEAVGWVGLLVPGLGLEAVWVSLLGFILGGTFGLALTLLVLRSADAESAGELSGMAQSVGYMVAAAGPPIFGWLYDVSGGWTIPLWFLVVVLAGKLVAGLPAGRAVELEVV
jgi:CP family cyanate transporter-like MFS transporter